MEKIEIKWYAVTETNMYSNERVLMSAFKDEQLQEWLNLNPTMLYEHDDGMVIWRWNKIEKKETEDWDKGLYVEGEILNNVTLKGDVKLFDIVNNWTLKALSITYKLKDFAYYQEWEEVGQWTEDGLKWNDKYNEKEDVEVVITDAEIIEVSIVWIGNNKKSMFEVKNNWKKEKFFNYKKHNIEWITKPNFKMEVIQNTKKDFINNSNKSMEELKTKLEELVKEVETLKATVEELKTTKEEVKDEVKEELKTEVKEEIKEDVKEEVKTEVSSEVKDEIKEDVKDEIKDEVMKEVKEEVAQQIEEMNKYKTNMLKSLEDKVKNIKVNYIKESNGSNYVNLNEMFK